jgi:hypothetical protein
MAAFALVDVPLQRQLLLRRLKMSHEEVKKEIQGVEGNVEVKAKQRARMREMASRRMLAAVPQADLVVMNPTHYAVALKYDEAKMAAPRVVAKGADLLALKIRDMAREPRCRCCRRRRWRARCTRTPRSTRRSRPRCSVPWRRCWPGSTSCAPRWPRRRRTRRRPCPQCRPTWTRSADRSRGAGALNEPH